METVAQPLSCDLMSLATAPAVPLTVSATAQRSPALAVGELDTILLWSNESGDSSRLDGCRVDRYTAARVGAIKFPPSTGSQSEPAIATNGRDFLGAWIETDPITLTSGVKAMLLVREQSGEIPRVIGVAQGGRHPRVAWNGRYFLIAWDDLRRVLVARVTADGVVLDPGGVVMADPPGDYIDAVTPALASNSAGDTLLVWQEDNRLPCTNCLFRASEGIRALHLDAEARPRESSSLLVAPRGSTFPAITWKSPYWYVAWRGPSSSLNTYNIRMRRSSEGGMLLDDDYGRIVAQPSEAFTLIPFTGGPHLFSLDSGLKALPITEELVPRPAVSTVAPSFIDVPFAAATTGSETFLIAYAKRTSDAGSGGVWRVFLRSFWVYVPYSPAPKRRPM